MKDTGKRAWGVVVELGGARCIIAMLTLCAMQKDDLSPRTATGGADLSFTYEATNTGNVDLFVCTLGRLVAGQFRAISARRTSDAGQPEC